MHTYNKTDLSPAGCDKERSFFVFISNPKKKLISPLNRIDRPAPTQLPRRLKISFATVPHRAAIWLSRDRLRSVLSDERDRIALPDAGDGGHVDGQLIHADAADDARPLPANEHVPAMFGKRPGNPVGIADGHGRDPKVAGRNKVLSVSHRIVWLLPLSLESQPPLRKGRAANRPSSAPRLPRGSLVNADLISPLKWHELVNHIPNL